jgi:uncharacterized protein YjbI with pentapeptide repeats
MFNTILTNSDLRGANLTGATMTDNDLALVIWSNTTCPNGVVQSTPCA